jgi:hypothetical protein
MLSTLRIIKLTRSAAALLEGVEVASAAYQDLDWKMELAEEVREVHGTESQPPVEPEETQDFKGVESFPSEEPAEAPESEEEEAPEIVEAEAEAPESVEEEAPGDAESETVEDQA